MTIKETIRHGSAKGMPAYVAIPEKIAKAYVNSDSGRRVVMTIGENKKHHCALMPDGDGGWVIHLYNKTLKKLGIFPGEQVTFQIEPDTSKYGLPMPDELKEMLYQDPEAAEIFESLTPGKQRGLIHMVRNVKSSEIRIHKALVILEHLRMHGELNGKLLVQEMKEANQNRTLF